MSIQGGGSRFWRNDIAEQTDAVDRVGILAFRSLKSLLPARQLILSVRQHQQEVHMSRIPFVVLLASLLTLATGWPLVYSGEKGKEAPAEDLLFPLPPQEVAAGKFEQWQREAAKKPSNFTYTRVEYDGKAYWVVEAIASGYGDPPRKIAVYAPTKGGSFRRCLLAGPIKFEKLAVAVDAKTGMLTLREEADSSRKGEVVLSCNLKELP
jgi:hypothetical protein